MNIRNVLEKMIAARASDLHLKVGTPPVVRVDGVLYTLDEPPPSADHLRAIVHQLLNEEQRLFFSTHNEIDFAFGVAGLARFRANIFMDRKGRGAVFRVIPSNILTAETLGLSQAILNLCTLNKGLVLVTGPTGSGKSTTLCGMIDYLNRNRHDHIITIEDPIEFVHENKSCAINQREVHNHTMSFKNALRDRKSTRLNSSHVHLSRMASSA